MTKIIAHRGNLNGPDIFTENDPDHLRKVLDTTDFDVEIDIWASSDAHSYAFGHDVPEYGLDETEFMEFVGKYQKRLWFHAKNIHTLVYLKKQTQDVITNIFIHNNDEATLTSSGKIWIYPGKENFDTVRSDSILVLPEISHYSKQARYNWRLKNFYGVCTDYPEQARKQLNDI